MKSRVDIRVGSDARKGSASACSSYSQFVHLGAVARRVRLTSPSSILQGDVHDRKVLRCRSDA